MCAWNGQTCTKDSNRGWGSNRASWQYVSQWYKYGTKGQCGDPLGLCDSQKQGNLTEYGWKSGPSNLKIPSGYFCTVTVPNPQANYYFFWITIPKFRVKTTSLFFKSVERLTLSETFGTILTIACCLTRLVILFARLFTKLMICSNSPTSTSKKIPLKTTSLMSESKSYRLMSTGKWTQDLISVG